MRVSIPILLSSVVFLSSPARARTVAVLEYRAGTSAASDVPGRIAKLLARKTNFRVLSPNDCRRRYGAGLDAAVAACAGEATCVSRLARRLRADEVLLVGITELGNVILDLVRIDARHGRVVARTGLTTTPSVRIPSSKLLGALKKLLPAEAFIRYGAVRIECNLKGASVTIDDKSVGLTPIVGPVRLRAPARHRIRIARKGYATFTASFFVPPEATITVKAQLVPFRASAPVYRKWWFWTALAGTVAATAAGIAGFLVWRHNSQVQPTRVRVSFP